jgi:hypothetical protein
MVPKAAIKEEIEFFQLPVSPDDLESPNPGKLFIF